MTTLSGLLAFSTGRISTRSMSAPPTKAMAIDKTMASPTGRPAVASFQEM